nr:protein CLAVATA 3 [Ipomoea batatas]
MGLSTAAKVVCVVFMTTLLLAMLQQSLADMKMEWGGKTKFRKVLYTLKDKKQKSIFNGNGNGDGNENENGNMKKKKKSAVEWELRAAPLGPDPLHHNGGSPRKKPTTMP